MAKRNVEDELAQLASLRHTESRDSSEAQLSKALRDRVNLIVAKGASVAADLQLPTLIPEMLAAYDRLFQNATKSDPQCWGKTAIAKALKTLGYTQAAPFVRGVSYRQMEPVWGGESDTAATLRGTCTLALVQCTDIPAQQILTVLVDAAADSAAPVRQDAVQGLEQWGSPEAVLLLRLKARLGDEDAAITGMVFDALLRLEETAAVAFVASFLEDSKEEIQEEAALALGSSKLEGAVAALIARWQARRLQEPFEIWIRALGTSRLPSAFAFLLEIIRSGRPREAAAALAALEPRRESGEAWEKIAAAVSDRGDGELQSVFERQFPRPEGE